MYSWKNTWNWEKCPVWFIHTGLPQHIWKLKALQELFKQGHFWGETITNDIPLQKEWKGTFGGQLWPACIGANEPYWSLYCKYAQLPLGTHPMEHRLGRKAIKNAGAWGYLITWIQIIEQAIQEKYPAIWIFDDDVRPRNDFPNSCILFEQVKQSNTWKMILWGASQQNWSHIHIQSSSQKGWYHPTHATDGSFSIMIHQDIYQPLLHMLKRYITPVDTGCLTELYRIYPNESYVIYPNRIMADVTSGEISAPVALNQVSKRYHWNIMDYSFILYQKQYIMYGVKVKVGFSSDTLPAQQQQNLLCYLKKLPPWAEIYFETVETGLVIDKKDLGNGFFVVFSV